MERKEYIKQIIKNLDSKKEKLDFDFLCRCISKLKHCVSFDWKSNHKKHYSFDYEGSIQVYDDITKEEYFDDESDRELFTLLVLSYFNLDSLLLILKFDSIYVSCKKLQIAIKQLESFIGCPEFLYNTARSHKRFVDMFYTLGLVEEKIDKIESVFPKEFLPYSCYKENFNNLNENWHFAEKGKIENLFLEVEKMKKKENKKNE